MSDGIYRGSVYANIGRDAYAPGDIVAVDQPDYPDERYVDIYAPRHAGDEEPWVSLDCEAHEFGRRYATEDAMPPTSAQGNALLLIDGTTSRPVGLVTAVPPRPAAPVVEGLELIGPDCRCSVRPDVHRHIKWNIDPDEPAPDATAGDALPALRDVLAAAARDAEKVRRVEELADRNPGSQWSKSVRRALDPS